MHYIMKEERITFKKGKKRGKGRVDWSKVE